MKRSSWKPRANATRIPRINIQQGDACSLQFADGQFDRALSMLVFHFVPDADRAVAEMRRVVRPGRRRGRHGLGQLRRPARHSDVLGHTCRDRASGGCPARRLFDQADEPASRARQFLCQGRDSPTCPKRSWPFAWNLRTSTTIGSPSMAGQGTQAAYLQSLPAETSQRIVTAVRNAYLAGQPDGPRSFVSVAWAARGTRSAHLIRQRSISQCTSR